MTENGRAGFPGLAGYELRYKFRGLLTHRHDGLPDGGEPWREVGRDVDVIKTNDGDIARHGEPDFVECADRADRKLVGRGKDGSEVLAS